MATSLFSGLYRKTTFGGYCYLSVRPSVRLSVCLYVPRLLTWCPRMLTTRTHEYLDSLPWSCEPWIFTLNEWHKFSFILKDFFFRLSVFKKDILSWNPWSKLVQTMKMCSYWTETMYFLLGLQYLPTYANFLICKVGMVGGSEGGGAGWHWK